MTLPVEVRQVLAELELVSHGSTQAWNPAGGHNAERNLIPPGDPNPPHIVYRERYERAAGPTSRRVVLREARTELERLRGHGIDRSRVHGESAVQEETRMVTQGEGWTVREVALSFKCTETRVRRVRLTAGADTETGKRADNAPSGDERAEARRMAGNGMSVRGIALVLGRPKSTVHDLLRAA